MPSQHQQVPQFQTAEYQGQFTTDDSCCICKKPVAGSFYRINGAQACSPCSQRVLSARPRDTHAAFSRALLYGLGGAFLGLVLYALVGILLHLQIGYVSLAVGFLVGKAMMMGSRNIGGRRYQWTAVVLTYAAVSLSAIPIAIAQYAHDQPAAAQVQQASPASTQATADAPAPVAQTAKPGIGKAIGMLLLLGLASPLLEFTGNVASGAIGLIILLVGVQIAWRMTAGVVLPAIEGPF
jgi:hypothetical protein